MTDGRFPPEERLARLRLARAEGVGPVAFQHLIRRSGSAARAVAALPKLTRGRDLKLPSTAETQAELEAGEALGARLLCVGEPDFPEILAAVDPPPPVIWVRGRAEILSCRAVAVVGARIASAAGQRFARALASDLGDAGYVVVSGMARGIDAAAHDGSLAKGSVAVLGGGVDDVYPPEHLGLYERLAVEGCVVSESPVGRKAQARDFPRRNRLISGLSLGVVVVEAELKSGSLITARLAAEQGREVFAVPGSPLDPRSKGTNDLIRQGATLCEGIEDVLRSLEAPSAIRRAGGGAPEPSAGEIDGEDIEGLKSRLLDLLSTTPVPRDELVRLTGAPPAAVYGALVELQLSGEAELHPGGLAAAGKA